MPQKNAFDAKVVRRLAKLLDETDLNEIEYEADGCRVRVVRHTRTTNVVTPAEAIPSSSATAINASLETNITEFPSQQVSAPEEIDHPGAVKSPMVGNVYVAPEPGADPFVREGDVVEEGQTLLIIEAMKVMNPIKASQAGKVTKIMVKEGDPVEFNEVLLVIE